MKINNITLEAKEVLNNFLDNKEKIIYYQEFLDHDGYDRYGPKSKLWDFYIIVEDEENDNFFIYDYHYENWFTKDCIKKYELTSKNNIKNINYYILDLIYNDLEVIDNKKLLNLINEKKINDKV